MMSIRAARTALTHPQTYAQAGAAPSWPSLQGELRRLISSYLTEKGAPLHASDLVLRACSSSGQEPCPSLVTRAARLMRRLILERSRGDEATRKLWRLDRGLRRLSTLDAKQAQIVELRYFAGLTFPETARVLGLSETVVRRRWRLAQLFLHRELCRSEEATGRAACAG